MQKTRRLGGGTPPTDGRPVSPPSPTFLCSRGTLISHSAEAQANEAAGEERRALVSEDGGEEKLWMQGDGIRQ